MLVGSEVFTAVTVESAVLFRVTYGRKFRESLTCRREVSSQFSELKQRKSSGKPHKQAVSWLGSLQTARRYSPEDRNLINYKLFCLTSLVLWFLSIEQVKDSVL